MSQEDNIEMKTSSPLDPSQSIVCQNQIEKEVFEDMYSPTRNACDPSQQLEQINYSSDKKIDQADHLTGFISSQNQQNSSVQEKYERALYKQNDDYPDFNQIQLQASSLFNLQLVEQQNVPFNTFSYNEHLIQNLQFQNMINNEPIDQMQNQILFESNHHQEQQPFVQENEDKKEKRIKKRVSASKNRRVKKEQDKKQKQKRDESLNSQRRISQINEYSPTKLDQYDPSIDYERPMKQPPILRAQSDILQDLTSTVIQQQNIYNLSFQPTMNHQSTDQADENDVTSSDSFDDSANDKSKQVVHKLNSNGKSKSRQKSLNKQQKEKEEKQTKQKLLKQKLEILSENQLASVNIFKEVEVFRAGTFKFEKNKDYIDNEGDIDKKLRHEFDVDNLKEKIGWDEEAYCKQRKQFVENKKKERNNYYAKYIQTFVPIFPFLYQYIERGKNLGQQKSLSLFGSKVYIKQGNHSDLSSDVEPQLIHKRAQIKFSLYNDPFLKYEESRKEKLNLNQSYLNQNQWSNYLINIDFENIKNIWIWKEQPSLNDYKHKKIYDNDTRISDEEFLKKFTSLTILIQFKKPCSAMKFIEKEIETEEFSDNEHDPKQIKCDDKGLRSRSILRDPKNNDYSQKFKRSNSGDHKTKNPGKGNKAPKFVRSPFNMTSNIEEDIQHKLFMHRKQRQKDEFSQVNYDTLINYWNNNQVIHMGGLASIESLDIFIKTIQMANPRAKIYQNNNSMANVMFLSKDQLNQELLSLRLKGIQFGDQLNLMRPTLRFSIMALLSQNKFNIFNQGLIDFMSMLTNGGWNKNDMVADFGAFIIDHINLFKDLDYKDDSSAEIEELFKALKEDPQIIEDFKKTLDSKNLIRQRRVLVTPTLFNYTVAREEEGNKVLRQYKQNLYQFIRLSFVNEDLDRGFYFTPIFEPYLGYIHSILQRGFFIGRGLRVKFLSYSNSQLKNHTFWFLADVENGIVDKNIIGEMGYFDGEKNILKRYARRGQCFSTTQNMQKLHKEEIFVGYPDVERNGYVFSDGCGWIEPSFAEQVANQFKYLQISAFQIRLGGAKGVIAVNKDIQAFKKDQTSEEFEYIEVNDDNVYKVLLRNSQIKFQSENFTLDIVRCSTFSQGYLNRQIIILLHCLGVPNEFFLRKQEAAKRFCQLDYALNRIQDKIQKINQKFGNFLEVDEEAQSLEDREHTFKKNKRILDLSKDIKLAIEPCKSFQAILKQSFLKGVDVMKEPIASSILNCMQLNQLMNLKKKARIILPDSCVLIGIIDPTGTLEQEEIFVQTRKDSFSMARNGYERQNRISTMKKADILNEIQSISQIIEGDVLVTRNPCTHPGDIRLLKAVNRPQLQYLFNVVVFSAKGDRPICNMMSGGDLDGDVYFVTWDKELLSYVPLQNILTPADYSQSDIIQEQPKGDSIADFIVFYMQRDVLGIVSNLWLLACDQQGQQGPNTDVCLKLSEMCSIAVDFAKHGKCVSQKNFRKIQKEFSKKYPDFLERDSLYGDKTYISSGVLGHLYRDLGIQEVQEQFMRNEWQNSICLDFQLEPKILEMISQDEHIKLMHSYLLPCFEQIVMPMNYLLKKLMMQFQLACEGELFSCDLKFRLCHSAQFDEKNFYIGDPGSQNDDAIKNLNSVKRVIIEKFKVIFDKLVNDAMINDSNALLNFSIALYLSTYFDSNPCGTQYFQKYQKDPDFNKFFQAWCKFTKENQMSPSKKNNERYLRFIKKIRSNYDFFKIICVEGEQGNSKKMRKLHQIKKLFCIPWLISGDTLLCYYPDIYKKDQEKFIQKRKKKASSQKQNQQQKPTMYEMQNMTQNQKLNYIFNIKNQAPEAQDSQEPTFIQIISDAHQKFYQMKIHDLEK